MHYDIGNMSRTQAAAFMKRRMAHANLGIIQEAMAEAGVKNIRVIGRSSDEVLKIDRDCEWQYSRDPEDVGNPEVTLRVCQAPRDLPAARNYAVAAQRRLAVDRDQSRSEVTVLFLRRISSS